MKPALNLSQKTPEELKCLITEINQHWSDQYKNLESRYKQLLEQLKLARLKRFGQSSEKQLTLFDEADKPLPPETKETLLTDEKASSLKKRKFKGRRPLPAHFPTDKTNHFMRGFKLYGVK
jgi:hypothetical protein